LNAKIAGPYVEIVTGIRRECVRQELVVKKGEKVYYDYATEDMYEDIYENVSFRDKTRHTEELSGPIAQEAMNVLYVALIQSERGGNSDAAALHKFLQDKFPEQIGEAHEWLQESIRDQVSAMRERVRVLEGDLSEFSL